MKERRNARGQRVRRSQPRAHERRHWRKEIGKQKSLFTVVRDYWGMAQTSQKSLLLSTVRCIGKKRWERRGKRETENRESKIGARQ